MASLYKVWRKNPYFPMNAVYRKFDDGFERCIMRDDNGRQEVIGYTGLVISYESLSPFVIGIQKTGIDTDALLARQADAG